MSINRSIQSTESDILNAVDDLKRIKGIGQSVEKRLNQAGIFSFAQLAASSPEQISKLLDYMIGMSVQKIEDQDWIGQAKQLAAESEPDDSIRIPASSVDQQRYETFSVKLLLDESNQVRRTNIVHVQKGTEKNWAGWDEIRLVAFVVENAALDVTFAKTTLQMSVESIPATDADSTLSSSDQTQSIARHAHPHHKRSIKIEMAEVFDNGGATPANIIATDQDWSIRLAWTLSGHGPHFGNWLVKLYLESMGPGKEYTLPDDEGIKVPLVDGNRKAPNVYSYAKELKFKAGDVKPGIYLLISTIAWEKYPGKLGNLMGFTEKSMLQFYDR